MKDSLDYYRKIIYPFVVNLIDTHIDLYGLDKEITLTTLSESDLSRFAAILFAEDPYDFSEIAANSEIYSFLTASIRTDATEDKIIWAEKCIDSVIKYYSPKMIGILEEVYLPRKSELTDSYNQEMEIMNDKLREINNGSLY